MRFLVHCKLPRTINFSGRKKFVQACSDVLPKMQPNESTTIITNLFKIDIIIYSFLEKCGCDLNPLIDLRHFLIYLANLFSSIVLEIIFEGEESIVSQRILQRGEESKESLQHAICIAGSSIVSQSTRSVIFFRASNSSLDWIISC